MGVGPFSSESNAQDSRQAAGDNSNLVHGKGTVTEAGGVTVTGKINTGAQNSKIGNNTIKAGKGSKITIDNGGERCLRPDQQISRHTRWTLSASAYHAGICDHRATGSQQRTRRYRRWWWLV
jgi:hypothetical protein